MERSKEPEEGRPSSTIDIHPKFSEALLPSQAGYNEEFRGDKHMSTPDATPISLVCVRTHYAQQQGRVRGAYSGTSPKYY